MENLEEIVQDYMGLIISVSAKLFRKYYHTLTNNLIEFDDIKQICSLALVEAHKRFDKDRGIKFTTFATATMEGEVKKFIRDKMSLVRVPRFGRELSEVHKDNKYLIMNISNRSFGAIRSFDEVIKKDDSNDLTLEDVLIGEEEVVDIELVVLKQALNVLDERELNVINKYYFQEKLQSEIAKEINLSQVQVSRIIKKAVAKLREVVV